jgi:hypothetical protein
MTTQASTLAILDDVLHLRGRARSFDRGTPLLGALPELDSMAVVGLLNALETRLGIVIEDDEISAETFSTVSSLVDYIDAKLA